MRYKPRPRCLRCGKAKFDDEQDAIDLIARKSRLVGVKPVPIRYYWSRRCSTFHVTSKVHRPELDGSNGCN